ncbi:MAG: hypothetical protein K0S67_1593 [Nitrososphaeraceae archaeon]|nr:hypothetical protein [Nitrososphaeraceae archaeon]
MRDPIVPNRLIILVLILLLNTRRRNDTNNHILFESNIQDCV